MVDIIATVGPASNSRQTLKSMIKAGMTIARINTKHASRKECLHILKCLEGLNCKILFDIKSLAPLEWIRDLSLDYIALSFAETVSQIRKVREIAGKTRVIAKIENNRGIHNIDALIKESDGIMVARGDLGKNIRMERVPVFQKIIIRKCNRKRKMTVIATEMLLSMTRTRVPEIAEVSDIANAVLEGADALMLSEETAIGRYPVLAVKTMRTVIRETQRMSGLLHKN